jgi:hypothetical protein
MRAKGRVQQDAKGVKGLKRQSAGGAPQCEVGVRGRLRRRSLGGRHQPGAQVHLLHGAVYCCVI